MITEVSRTPPSRMPASSCTTHQAADSGGTGWSGIQRALPTFRELGNQPESPVMRKTRTDPSARQNWITPGCALEYPFGSAARGRKPVKAPAAVFPNHEQGVKPL